MNSSPLCDIDNDIYIRVVVVVRSSGDLDVLVGHANVVCIDLEILRGRHDSELDCTLRTERLIAPLPDRADLLDRSNTYRCTGSAGLGGEGAGSYVPLLAMRT
jgi:hypothetical protein